MESSSGERMAECLTLTAPRHLTWRTEALIATFERLALEEIRPIKVLVVYEEPD